MIFIFKFLLIIEVQYTFRIQEKYPAGNFLSDRLNFFSVSNIEWICIPPDDNKPASSKLR